MTKARERVEAQLQQARATLEHWVGKLDAAGVARDQRRRDAKWRNLNARCTQLNVRLKTIDAGTALDEELKQRKAQKAAAAEAEAAEAPKKAAKKGKGSEGKKAEGKKEKKPKAEKKPAGDKEE